jgi:CHAT domain-containing protein/tetratricopeptide (TPR) repeat protein
MHRLGWLLIALVLWAGPVAAQEDPSWARAQRYKAVELFRKQDYETALPLFQDAQRTYERALGETSTESIDTLNDVANTLGRLNRAAEAVPVLEQLARLRAAKHGERDERTLNALAALGGGYFQASRFAEAVATNERLLALSTAVRGERHPATIQVLRDLGIYQSSLGGYGAALPYLVKATELRLAVLGPNDIMTLSVMNDVGNAYLFTGDYAKALETYERIVKIKLDKGGEAEALDSLRQLAILYRSLGRTADAVPIFDKLYQTKLAKSGENSADVVFALADLVSTYADEGRREEALRLAERAVALQTRLTGRAAQDSGFLVGLLGGLYDQMGRSAEAIPLLEQDMKREQQRWGATSFTALRGQRAIGVAYRHLGRRAEAIAVFETVLQARVQELGEGHPETIESLRDLAFAYETADRAKEAVPLYERLVAAVEALRARGDLSSENRQALFAQWVEAYKSLARLRVVAGDAARGFALAELSKARTLLESTAFRRAAQSAELSAAEQQRLQGFEHQLADLGDRVAGAQAEQKLILEARRDGLVRELTAFRAELAAHHPKYARLSDVRIVDAADGRMVVPEDAVLISYLVADDAPIVFTMTRKDGLRAHALPKFPELAKMIADYREALLSPDAWQGPNTPAARLARALSERLLVPIAAELRGKRRWIVSPDGALAMLPFETLELDGKTVIITHDLSYIQSLSMLALLIQRDADYRSLEGRKTLFAMGDAQYEAAADGGARGARRGAAAVDIGAFLRGNAGDKRGIQRAFDLLEVRWPDLPGSGNEVDMVARAFPGQPVMVLKQAQANEAKLLELNAARELAAYRYLLFSTHGYLSPDEPALSAIVLSQRDKAAGTDGYVTASEWPAYELRSDLIVLSACETGLGKVVQGEGVMGLPYALYVAGNRNTLLSLWSVVDDSTAAFMARLFAQLAAGKSQVQALNDTKREFIAAGKYAAPLFWAPFVLYGS